MPHRTPRILARGTHHSRHLLYSFFIGAFVTAVGFLLAVQNSDEAAPGESRKTTLVVAGSETLRPLVSACAEDFMMRHKDVDVIVRGGGTSTGVAALLAGQVDLAMISRELTAAEQKRSIDSGPGPHLFPIATEAIAIVVHPTVSISALDIRQLAGLLDGTTSDWSALSSSGGAVVVVGRAGTSGTALVVEEKVLDGRPLATHARRLANHEEVIKAVAAVPGAIGYADAHLARKYGAQVKLVGLKRQSGSPSFMPEPASVARGDYLLARTLFIVALGPPITLAGEFVDHCRAREGRRLIEAAGFLPIMSPAKATPAPATSAPAIPAPPVAAQR